MSKFRPPSAFSPERSDYKLLPIRFDRRGGDVFLTNLVGEPYTMADSDFSLLVEGALDSSSEIYHDLLSKHFVIDDDSSVSLDLLGLKLRTKYSRLRNFTALHIFVVTLRCEHSCPYCQVSRQNDDTADYDMSREAADRALDLAFRSPSPTLKIEFQGGEPLLNFSMIKYIVERAELRNAVARKNLAFVIATNLAPLTDEILRFCKKNRIYISTSLDGPRDLHNRNRPRRGHNSYDLAVQGIVRVRGYLGRDYISALMTTTEASLDRVEEIVDEYLAQGLEGIFLRPLSPYGFAVKTKWFQSYGVSQWLEFYFRGLDYIISLNKTGIHFPEFYARTVLQKMITPFQPGYIDMMSPAGIGIGGIVYNYDGRVFASDESRMLSEMGDQTFCIGDVFSSSYEEVFTNPVLLQALEESFTGSAPMCVDCAYEPYCGSDPVFHHATEGDFAGQKWRSGFCTRNTAIFRGIVDRYRDSEIRPIFEAWVR